MKLQVIRDGVVIDVHVKPESKQFRITVESDQLVVFCQKAPKKGQVNTELIKELSKLFKRNVEIVSGFSSKQKKILIRGMEGAEVERILGCFG